MCTERCGCVAHMTPTQPDLGKAGTPRREVTPERASPPALRGVSPDPLLPSWLAAAQNA